MPGRHVVRLASTRVVDPWAGQGPMVNRSVLQSPKWNSTEDPSLSATIGVRRVLDSTFSRPCGEVENVPEQSPPERAGPLQTVRWVPLALILKYAYSGSVDGLPMLDTPSGGMRNAVAGAAMAAPSSAATPMVRSGEITGGWLSVVGVVVARPGLGVVTAGAAGVLGLLVRVLDPVVVHRAGLRLGGRGRSRSGGGRGLAHVDVGRTPRRLSAAGDQETMRREARAPAERRRDRQDLDSGRIVEHSRAAVR